jgi:hypothetical protein
MFTFNLVAGACLDVHVVDAIKHIPLASLRFLHPQISRAKVRACVARHQQYETWLS